MPQAKGYKGRLTVDFEDGFGAASAVKCGKVLPVNTLELAAKQTLIDPQTITGTRNPVEPGRGRVSVDGSVVVPMCYRSIGFWLKSLFGEPETASNGDGTYTHVFLVGDEQPSMIVEKAFLNINKYFVYNGCKTNNFKLSWGSDGELTASIDLMGANETTSEFPYDEAATEMRLDRINEPHASMREDGAVMHGLVATGEFTISTGLDGDQYTVGDGGCRGDIPEGLIGISGTLKTLFKDTSLLEKGAQGIESSLEVRFANGKKSLTFSFPEIIYERTSPPISGPAGVQAEIAWRAYYDDSAAASAVVATLVNDVWTYDHKKLAKSPYVGEAVVGRAVI